MYEDAFKEKNLILVLSLLNKEPRYGYQIAKTLEKKAQTIVWMQEGVIYLILHYLEKKKLVVSGKQEMENKRARVYYKVTNKGRRYLKKQVKL